jgi:ketosteroid isomerase-like protein
VENEVLKFEHDWTDAQARHDLAFLEQAEAEEYTYTDPTGRVSHKDDDLARAQLGDIQISSFTLKDEKVQIYGETAVITGQTDIRGTDKGTDITGSYRWTDSFVRRDGAWKVVASQAAIIGGDDE